jgi:putative endonuclease
VDVVTTTKQVGDEGEARALHHLQQHGLELVQRNYRLAQGPRARGGEIDLIMRERNGTLVFVEVRRRATARFGGAAASVTPRKQQRVVLAARHFLMTACRSHPPCRFDVVTLEAGTLQWIRGAFTA